MIYFAQLPTGSIKIGYSSDVNTRMDQLRGHYGAEPALLLVMDGDRETEAEMHQRFSHLRIGRLEQFKPGPDLMAFIGRPLLVSPNPEAVEAMPPKDFDPTRDDGTVRFDKLLAARARQVSLARGISMAEYLSEMTRPQIDRDYAKLLHEIEGK